MAACQAARPRSGWVGVLAPSGSSAGICLDVDVDVGVGASVGVSVFVSPCVWVWVYVRVHTRTGICMSYVTAYTSIYVRAICNRPSGDWGHVLP